MPKVGKILPILDITDDLQSLPKTECWAGLRSIGIVEREYREAGKLFKEKRFFINSIQPIAETFAYAEYYDQHPASRFESVPKGALKTKPS